MGDQVCDNLTVNKTTNLFGTLILNDHMICLRGLGGDRCFVGLGFLKDGWGNKQIDGPVLWGNQNGALGTVGYENEPWGKIALTWDINNNVEVTGNLTVKGDMCLANADCAEDFDIGGAELVQPGTVMVFGKDGALRPSEKPYDKRVAGVISGAGDFRPGITLDKQDSSKKNRLPLALTGKAYCKVDADYEPVEVGDLLTTSSTPGHAMKAHDPVRSFGAVVGKAIQPLKTGRDLIPLLVSLR